MNFDYDEEIYDRTIPVIALKVLTLMCSDKKIKVNESIVREDLAMQEPIEEIS